jgi:hypothetical protein
MSICAALTLAACSGGDNAADEDLPTATATATATVEASAPADVCGQLEALQRSVMDLVNTDILSAGINGVVASVDQVRTDAQALRQMAAEANTQAVDAFLTTVQDSKETISRISNRQLREEIKDVESAITRISTAAASVETDLQESEC